MNREQRRAQARRKAPGMSYAGQLARRRIGQQTLRMAMEDQAVALAADIKCQQMLWGAVIALNEKFGFGEKRTRDFLEAMGVIADEFEAMRAENGYEYAEEKLRQRAEQVSGVKIQYQHEAERAAWEQMMTQGSGNRQQETGDEGTRIATGSASPRNDRTEGEGNG